MAPASPELGRMRMRIKTNELNEGGATDMFEWDGVVQSLVVGPLVVFFTADPGAANGGIIDPVDLSEAEWVPLDNADKEKLEQRAGGRGYHKSIMTE